MSHGCIGAAALAALNPGETRIATGVLLARVQAEFPGLAVENLGRALAAAGWKKIRWREAGGLVWGHAPPASRPASDPAPPPLERAAAVPMAGAAGVIDRPGAASAPAGPVWPPVMAGPLAMPPGTICSACGGRRWWVDRSNGPPTWSCCRCAPLSGHAAAAHNWFF